MRKLFTLLMAAGMLAMVGNVQAQEETNSLPRTDIEVFEAQTNVVIVKGVGLVNSINMSSGTVSVLSKESTEAGSGRKQYGMLLEFRANDNWRMRAVVDYSELDSMLDGIDYLKKVTADVTQLSTFDAAYTTKSGFRVIAHGNRRQGSVQTFIQFEDSPRIALTSDQISQFRDLVYGAKSALDALSAK